MALLKPTSPRRREVRRNLARRRFPLLPWLDRRSVAWACLFALATAGFGWWISPGMDAPRRYNLGQIVRQAIVPRVEFKAEDADATAMRRIDAGRDEPAVFKQNKLHVEEMRDRLNGLLHIGREYENVDQIPLSDRQDWSIDADALAQLKKFSATEDDQAQWQGLVGALLDSLGTIALVDEQQKQRATKSVAKRIRIQHPKLGLLTRYVQTILGTGDVASFRRKVTSWVSSGIDSFPAPIRKAVIEAVIPGTQAQLKPLYVLDVVETSARRTAAEDDPRNAVESTYRRDQVLVAAGKQLDETDIKLIGKEHEAYLAKLRSNQLWLANELWLVKAGRGGLMALLGLALWIYVLAFNRTVSRNALRGLVLVLLILLCQAGAVFATGYRPEFIFAFATFPTLLVAVVLAVSYNQRFALAIGAMHALLVAVSLDLSVRFTIVLLLGVAIAVALLTEVRTRSKLVIVGGWIGLTMALAALVTGMTGQVLSYADGMPGVASNAIVALLSGVALGIFVQGILPGIERLFKVTTAMSLRELNDVSRPLLQQLAEAAPGTYQHSLRIADMAEAAADAIGANGRLCRVGAMYHDIGKIHKPMYFVENQAGGPNRHSKLSPAMSLLIIVAHVKDGMELAREYALPPVIRHLIESHHGTTLVEYFYHAARQQQKGDGNGNEKVPAEFSFRYPGPKPQTKEAAIMMLSDSVEGAARTLPEQTAVRLEKLVHNMATKRLMDGQFDECSITLQELHKIEVAITKVLCAVYHGRVEYPSDEELAGPAEQQAAPAAAS